MGSKQPLFKTVLRQKEDWFLCGELGIALAGKEQLTDPFQKLPALQKNHI